MPRGAPPGPAHPNWKGDDADVITKHQWISRRKTKTGVCSRCGESRKTDWANIDHEYRRVLDDYIELCVSCHRRHDYAKGFRVSWSKGKKCPQLGRKCEPGCTCGRHHR